MNVFDNYKYSFLQRYQKKCFEIAQVKKHFAFYLDLGLGKTLLALVIIHNKGGKALVVTRQTLIKSVWTEDIKKFLPELTYVNLCGTKAECKIKRVILDANIYFINHEQFLRSWNDICEGIDTLVVDESSLMRNYTSKTTSAFIQAENIYKFPNIYLLSGLPAPNRSQEYFSQMRLLDDTLFGNNYQAFVSEYFKSIKVDGKRQTVLKNPETFQNLLKSISVYIAKEDLKDIPGKLFVKEYLQLTEKQKLYYDIIVSDAKEYLRQQYPIPTLLDGQIKFGFADNIFCTKIVKCMEVFCGFYIKNEGNGKKIIKIKTQLYDAMWNELQKISEKQCLIWTTFDYEQTRVVQYLIDKKKSVGYIIGKHNDKEKQDAIESFKNGDVQYLVLKASSMKYGLNLQNCTYSLYTSHNYSLDNYEQSQGRTHRGLTQKKVCTYISFIFENTLSETIYQALQDKKDVAISVLNYLKGEEGFGK